MVPAILFCLGLALGSFLHVLASRYRPDEFLLTRRTLGGRSHCPHCMKPLRWHELIPLLSFLAQRGRCRSCKARISWSYFWVELASGLIAAFVPLRILATIAAPHPFALAGVWTAALLVLLSIAVIDLRLYLIPDELAAALGLLGIAAAWLTPAGIGGAGRSSFGPYASVFGLQGNIWMNHFAAAAIATLFFAALAAATRGRGMGMGDVKLAFALGLLFGWPDILAAVMLAFVIGAAVGLGLIARGAKQMKSAVPFGPFLALASAIVLFWGGPFAAWYFGLLGW